MKNTSLFVSFWAMPERKPSADPPEGKPLSASDLRGVIGGAEWRPLIASYRKLSPVVEHDKMGGTESENSSTENFPFRDTHFVMRSAKQKTDTKFHVENGEATFS